MTQRKLGEDDTSWALPGGKIKFGKSSKHAIERELSEEFSLKNLEIQRRYICDHMFRKESVRHHQILFIYLVANVLADIECSDPSLEIQWVRKEDYCKIRPEWFHKIVNLNATHFEFNLDS